MGTRIYQTPGQLSQVPDVILPTPQIEVVNNALSGGDADRLNDHDTLQVYVRDVDPVVYTRNPELWLFRYKRRARRGGSNNSHTTPQQWRKWVHPSHNNGAAKVGWSSGGGGRFNQLGVALPGFTTEWTLPAEFVRQAVDLGEFFTTTGAAPVYAAPGSSAWAIPPGQGGNTAVLAANMLKQVFKFAVTIDDPADPMHRIVGPASSRVIISQESQGVFDPTGANIQRLKYYVDQSWGRGQ